MSLLILNYVLYSSSVPWAAYGVLEVCSVGIRLWLPTYSNVTIKSTVHYYKVFVLTHGIILDLISVMLTVKLRLKYEEIYWTDWCEIHNPTHDPLLLL